MRLGRGQPKNVVVVRNVATVFNQTVVPSSIASDEAFGSATVFADQSVAPSGIASAEAFGSSSLQLFILPSGVASAEAFGSHIVGAGFILPSGIDSAEAFGSPTVFPDQFVSPSSIASDEAFGAGVVTRGHLQTVSPSGIASAEAFGFPEVANLSRYVLRPRTIQETPAGEGCLFSRYGIHRGISILKRAAGQHVEVRFPSQVEIEEADAYYLGGHVYVLTSEEAAGLTSDGFGDLITLELV